MAWCAADGALLRRCVGRRPVNWDALGAVAELAGAAGVIASLLYLTAQVRASNRAAAVAAKLESTRLLNAFMDLLIERPELDELLTRSRTGLAALSPEEYRRFSNMSLKAFWYFSAAYFQFRARTLAESDWFEVRAVIHYWVGSRGCREWWAKVGRFMYGEPFVAFVESEFAALAAQGRRAEDAA